MSEKSEFQAGKESAGAKVGQGRAAVATGAAARDDAAASAQGKRYVVAAKNERGYNRAGHFFGREKAVYHLDDALAARLRADGLVVINDYRPSDKGTPEIDIEGPARTIGSGAGTPGHKSGV